MSKRAKPKVKTDKFDYFLAHAPTPPPWFRWTYRQRRDGEDSGAYEREMQFSRYLGWCEVYAERMVAISGMGKRRIVRKFNQPVWGDALKRIEKLAERIGGGKDVEHG